MDFRKNIKLSMYLSIAIVLSIIESIIPIFNGAIPGIKLGLANIIIVTILYSYSFKDAFFISIMKVILVGILRTGIFSTTFFLSLTGSLSSIIIMGILKKTKLSIVGTSTIGSIFHTIGQLITAILILKNINLVYYFPYITLSALITGIIIGLLSKHLITFLKENFE